MNKKRFISTVLAIIMVLSLLPMMPQIVRAETYGDFEYFIEDGVRVIITKYKGNAATVEIPAAIDGKPMTKIGNRAFEEYRDIRRRLPAPNFVFLR